MEEDAEPGRQFQATPEGGADTRLIDGRAPEAPDGVGNRTGVPRRTLRKSTEWGPRPEVLGAGCRQGLCPFPLSKPRAGGKGHSPSTAGVCWGHRGV